MSDFVAIVVLVLYVIYSIASTIYNAREIKKIHEIKLKNGYNYHEADIKYKDNKSIYLVVGICFLAGMLGGIVGIAGGIVLNPLFLYMGMIPTVVAATNQYLAMFSCISVTSQFIFIGLLNLQYTIFIGLFVVIGSIIGLKYMNDIVRITGR